MLVRCAAFFPLLLLLALPALAADKLIALTFDDGPRPYVLFGTQGDHPAPGLLDTLDDQGVKGTFFVVGWRLTPGTWGERRHEENIGVTCIAAAEQMVKRGHELEDHTFTHIELRRAERSKGEQWVVSDVERAAQLIKAVTGIQPRYVRPQTGAYRTMRARTSNGTAIASCPSRRQTPLHCATSIPSTTCARGRTPATVPRPL